MARPITWIHTADLHLDQPVTDWYGCTKKAMQRREDYRVTFQRILSVVQEKKVGFLLIAGDFLEHGYVQASTLKFVQDGFRTISDTHVLIAPGNHDPYRKDSFYRSQEDWPENVHIFGDQWEALYFKEYDLTVYGRGFADYIEPKWISPPQISSKGCAILISHGTFTPYSERTENSSYFPIPEKELERYPLHYVALGHNHKASVDTLNNRYNTTVCYPGSPEALNWKETGERFVVFGELDRNRVDIKWIPIQSRSYERVVCDITDCTSREDLLTLIQRELQSSPLSHCFLIVLEGRYSAHINMENDLFWLKDQIALWDLFHCEIRNRAKPDFDLSYYRNQKGTIGLFVRKIEERIKQNPDQKMEYELALYKGLEALCATKK